jgi:hypothetical protein
MKENTFAAKYKAQHVKNCPKKLAAGYNLLEPDIRIEAQRQAQR